MLTASLLHDADIFVNQFHSALQGYINDDKELQKIIIWAQEKAKDYSTLNSPILARLLVLDTDLMLVDRCARVYLKNITKELDPLNNPKLSYAFALDRMLDSLVNDAKTYGKVNEVSLQTARETANLLGLSELAMQLGAYFEGKEHKLDFDGFQQLIISQRNVGYAWQLKSFQRENLRAFLAGNVLLTECLNVASVSDRIREENRLFNLF